MKKISENGMKLWMVTFIALFCSMTQAQVTIGIQSNPYEGALLDLKESDPLNLSDPNSAKGVLFPKVSLIDVKSLKPLITRPAAQADSAKMRGMIVYNVNENANGIDPGLSVWNGEEWMSVVGGGANKAAVFSIDWANVTVNGTYVKGKTLTLSNTLSVPVIVSKKGIYSITAASANGYAFSASGEFMAPGSYTLTLNSLGTPAQSTSGTNPPDELAFMNNNLDITDANLKVTVTVDDVEPAYTCDCGTIAKSNISLKTGQAAQGELIVEILAPLDAAGAEYKIETNKINGVQFSGSGKLQGGNQRIHLTASGTPAKSGQQTFTITTNSTAASGTTCSVTLPVAGRKIKVLTMENQSGERDLGVGSGSTMEALLKNKTLFGPTSAYCLVEDIIYENKTNVQSSYAGYDIVIFSYDTYPEKATEIDVVYNFITAGGVVILCSDVANRGKTDLLKKFFPNSTFSTTATTKDGERFQFPTNNNSQIINGKYANLSGKYLGLDGGYNVKFNIPSDIRSQIEVIAGDAGGTPMFRLLNNRLIICGDGGPFVGKTNSSSSTQYPLRNNLSSGTSWSGGDIHNAHLFVNIMMWAITERLRLQP
jgi:hypothetical protein